MGRQKLRKKTASLINIIIIISPLLISAILISQMQGKPSQSPVAGQSGLLKLNEVGGPTFGFVGANSSSMSVARGSVGVGEFSLNITTANGLRLFYDNICNCTESFAKSISISAVIAGTSYHLEGSDLPGGYTRSQNPIIPATVGIMNATYKIGIPASATPGVYKLIIVIASFNSFGNQTTYLRDFEVNMNVN